MSVTLLVHEYTKLNCKIQSHYLYSHITNIATHNFKAKLLRILQDITPFKTQTLKNILKFINSYVNHETRLEDILNIRYLAHLINLIESDTVYVSLDHDLSSFNLKDLKIEAPCLTIYEHATLLMNKRPWGKITELITILWIYSLELYYIKNGDISALSNLSLFLIDVLIVKKETLNRLDYLKSIVQKLRQVRVTIKNVKIEGLNRRQIKALKYVLKHGKITRSTYTKLSKVSFMTAYRDLQDLIRRGFLKAEGHNNLTHYLPTRSFNELIARASLK